MQLPDVNVLIYAHREDAPEHARYATWLRTLTASAIAFCQRLATRPRAVMVRPTPRHWEVFVKLCRDIEGPLVSDAYLAALAIEHGCELISTDSDFARFAGLRWRHPLSA